MKVLAFNCSPKMSKGNTALILDPFLDGMREEGATVELFFTRKLEIKPGSGEFFQNLRSVNEGNAAVLQKAVTAQFLGAADHLAIADPEVAALAPLAASGHLS